jgi:hypothetical protein
VAGTTVAGTAVAAKAIVVGACVGCPADTVGGGFVAVGCGGAVGGTAVAEGCGEAVGEGALVGLSGMVGGGGNVGTGVGALAHAARDTRPIVNTIAPRISLFTFESPS